MVYKTQIWQDHQSVYRNTNTIRKSIIEQCYTLDMYKLLCKRTQGRRMVQTARHVPFFMLLKITFSHCVFIFFIYLIKVEHPPTKLQVLPRSASSEDGTNNIEREREGCTHIKHFNIMGGRGVSKQWKCHPWEKQRCWDLHQVVKHKLYKRAPSLC